MRSLPLLLVLATTPAYADSFVGATGGLMIPLGDSHKNPADGWSDMVSSSPKLGLRVGATGESGLGGMISADWTPISSNAQSQFTDVSAHRFRILAQFLVDRDIASHIVFSGRAGVGVDIAHASYSAGVGGLSFSGSDTDTGLGFEFGGGVWFKLGNTEIGGEVALPVGLHSHKASNAQDITLDYTSYDIDLLFGVRLRSK
ncbi:MAG TPA: hypothetical protein VLT45_18490 [Kofleriaceae bacterium]|nr:hypothetical protein [Kofleriaceae bacterium]